jgi:CYTH domain-containing protein
MAKETELKFLLYEQGQKCSTLTFDEMFGERGELERKVQEQGSLQRQAYLKREEGISLAATLGLDINFDATTYRIRSENGVYTFTVKGKGHIQKREEEVEMSEELFENIFAETSAKLSKYRLKEEYFGKKIEIDYLPDLRLMTGEIEGSSEEELRKLPEPGKDISTEVAYKMQMLAGQDIYKMD